MAAPERFVNFDIGQPQALRDATNSVFGASGTNHAQGLVPDPGSTPGTTRFLREDETWQVPPTLATPVSVANGGTGLATLTAHAVLLGEGTGNVGAATIGTAGNVLTDNGAGADPTFQAIPFQPGNVVLLNTLTANNSATLSDTTSLTATYSEYEIVWENLLPATNSVTLEFQVHSGGAFKNTTYVAACFEFSNAGTATQTATTFIPLSNITVPNTGAGSSGKIRIINPASTAFIKHVYGQGIYFDATNVQSIVVGGFWNGGNGAVDGFQILFSAGNITSGTVKVYGLK